MGQEVAAQVWVWVFLLTDAHQQDKGIMPSLEARWWGGENKGIGVRQIGFPFTVWPFLG